MQQRFVPVLCVALVLSACGSDDASSSPPAPLLADPGSGAWQAVPSAQVGPQCGLDPALLAAADTALNRSYAVIRYGKLCHEYYPAGADAPEEVYSTTKSMGAVVTGIAAYQTRNLPRSTRKTGPLSDTDRVDHWLDTFTFNKDALVAHVLAMEAHNPDLSYGHKQFQYDLVGQVQINRVSDIINAALQQDRGRLGDNLEEFTQRFLFEPLGMHDSSWTAGLPDKNFSYSWSTTVRDMARLGVLILHDGMWSGQRILDASWVYKMTHPSFEDANTGYGYLTWLNSRSNYTFGYTIGGLPIGSKLQGQLDACAPVALYPTYPHAVSGAPSCNYDSPYSCEQTFDVGVWYAAGLGGQYIIGHRALDLLLVIKNLGDGGSPAQVWSAIRPALLAYDPTFRGDQAGFCEQYGRNAYAPFRH